MTKKITPEALTVFRRMQALEEQCTCTEPDWEGDLYDYEFCPACEKWWDEHKRLHALLGMKPWQFPCVENPDAAYDPNNAAFAEPDLEAQRRYRELEKAARA